MRPSAPSFQLTDALIDAVVTLIRKDRVLGRGTLSSWETVAPSDYEARERVRDLVDGGAVRFLRAPSPREILEALKRLEAEFLKTSES